MSSYMNVPRHTIGYRDVVSMASGTDYCRVCARFVKMRGDKWVHTSVDPMYSKMRDRSRGKGW